MGQVLIDQGALKMALNVLRRAGKDEVADELEKSAVTPEVRACAHDPKPTGMYEPFDTACGKCGDFCTDALAELLIKATIDEWQPGFTNREYDSDETEENEFRERVLSILATYKEQK